MPNSVSTTFELNNLESYISGLGKAGDSFDNLGAKAVSFNSITSDIRASLLETQKSVLDLTKAAESVAPKPTISRYYENEAAEVKKQVAGIRSDIESINKPTNNPGALSQKRIAGGIDFGDPKPTLAGASKPLNDDLYKSAIANEINLANISKSSFSAIAEGEKALTSLKLAESDKSFNNVLSNLNKRRQAEDQAQKQSAKSSDLLTQNVALAGFAALGVGVKAFKDLVDVGLEADKENRKFAASAIEAGKSVEYLSGKVEDYKKISGQSEIGSKETIGKLALLSDSSGVDLGKLQNVLLNRTSAFAVDTDKIGKLADDLKQGGGRQLLKDLGVDEGKALKDYAASLGKTVEQLTRRQQIQAKLNPLLRDEAEFNGANADRLNSLSGQVETANAKLSDLYTNLGQGVTQSVEFRDFLKTGSDLLETLTTNLQNVRKELANPNGKTPKQLAEDEANKPGSKILDAYKNAFSVLPATLLYPIDALTDGFKTANDRYLETVRGAKDRRVQTLTDTFTAEQKVIEQNNKAAAIKQKENAAIVAREIAEQKNLDLTNFTKREEKRFARAPSVADARFDLTALESVKKNIPAELYEGFKDKLGDFLTNDFKKATAKIDEISKKATDTFDDLSVKLNRDNPIASVFAQGTKELDKLKESLKGLSPELQNQAIAIQNKLTADSLFSARLGNKLSAQDLRDDADNFRNNGRYTPSNYQSVIDASVSGKSNPFGFGKTYAQFVQEGNGKDPLTKQQQNDVFNVETFNALTRNGVDPTYGIQYLGKVRGAALGTEDLTLQQRLDRKIDLITSSNPVNADQQATAERALISLTSGIDPAKLTSRERDVAATARENEATRREAYEAKAQAERISQTALQNRIADGIDKLNLIAQKEGFQAVEVILKDQTAAGAEIKKQTKTADRSDVEDHYNLGTNRVGNKLTSF